MGKIRMRSTSISDNPSLQSPVFHFSPYVADGNHTYYNNENVIDFVTDGNSLYVCLSHDGVTPTYENIEDNGDFLKIVSQGPQGIRGPRGHDGDSAETPRLNAEFDNDQLRVYVNGELETVSPRLTGKAWRPKLEDNMIVWELSNKMYSPEPIDLEELRPTQEKPLLLRVDSDNTKRSDETSGPAGFIQWKYEGDPHWTNLISISELMNLTLAGVSIWKNDEGKWHFGHRKVIGATYESDKVGNRIISKVQLGDVLFDAGELPFEENSETRPDYSIDINLIYTRLAMIEEAMVKSVNGVPPGPDGDVKLNIPTLPNLDNYAQKDWVNNNFQPKGPYLTEHQSLDGLVRGVKANGTTHSPVNGIVDLGNIGGGSSTPTDTSDCVKAITINNVRKTPENGEVVFTIDVGGTSLFDIRLRDNRYLEKTNDGTNWIPILDLNSISGGTGCERCWTEEDIIALIDGRLSGVIPTDYLTEGDLDDYITRSELSGYATEAWVLDKIAQALNGGMDIEYFRTFTLYTRNNSRTEAPNGPLDGVWEWNLTQGDILADSSQKSGWDNHPQNATPETPYLWMASATFSSVTSHEVKPSNASTAWTKICLTGEPGADGANGYNGTDGADGNGVEFIYTLVRTINDKPLVQRPVAPVGQGEDDIPDGWEDHPQGIGYYLPSQVTTTLSNLSNEETLFGIELASMRTFDGETWSAYCEPFIWSMWGEDGVDGDGVEYIFFVADENSVEINTTTGRVSLPVSTYYVPDTSPNFIPTTQSQVDALGSSYQVADWIQVADNNWTDNPSDVDAGQPFEFVSMRKYHDETGWGPFCTPRLWSHYGGITVNPVTTVYETSTTVYSPYKCYAFYRANENDNTLHTDLSNYRVIYDFSAFGTQSNPDPVYSDLTTEQKNMFYEHPEVYSKTLNGNTQVSITWHDTVPSGDGQLWLITAHIGDENDPLTDTGWTSPTRWGDKAGFNVEYCADEELGSLVYANPSLINNNNMTFNDYSGSDEEREALWEQDMLQAGYGVWSDTVEDPVYMATTTFIEGVWSNWTIARIKGEPGAPGEGLPGSPGSDGNSIEFVYYRTKGTEPGIEFLNELERGTYDPETASVRTKTNKDPELDKFFPAVSIDVKTDGDYWHDHPSGVDEVYTHEWVATRTSAIQDGRRYWTSNFSIALWSKFGANGRDGDGIEYVFWGLNEEQNRQINCTWPTQKARSVQNGGCNVDPTRKDTPANRSIGDPEYLPAILINNVKVQAVDNNPGITNNVYVYASKRKYDGSTRTWGEFSEIKLWNEQNTASFESVVLDITDDKHQILVDKNGVIKDSDLQFRCNTSAMCLYKDLVLLGNGKVLVNNVLLAYDNPAGTGTNKMVITNNTATVESNGVTASVIATSAYKNEDSNSSSINLRVTFQSNTVLNDAFVIPITVVDTTDTYSAVDSLSIVPTLYKGPELTHVPNVQKTSGEGTHDYGQSDLSFWGTPIYGTLEQVMPTEYWFGYDGKTSVNFKLTDANKTALRALDDGTALHHENFYFDRSGNQISSSSAYYFRIQINNSDYNDNLDPYRKWTSTGYVRLSSFDSNANEQTKNYPIDEMLFGIGVDGVCTDDATVYIVYPGKNGDPGQPGQPGEPGKYKINLYCLGTENTYDGKWQSSYVSPGATIATLTSSPNAWSETKPTVTSSKPHIWTTSANVTIGSESTQVCVWETPWRITPVDGNVTHTYEYLAGTIMRTSEWNNGVNNTTKYWDGNTRVITENGVESASSTDEGIKYLDVVSVVSNGKTSWYKCIQNHAKRSTNPATDTSYWAEFSIMGDAAFHNLLVENAAYIESLTSKQVVITDNNNIVAGMTSGTISGTDLDGEVTPGNIRIWAGATENGNLATAPFTVDNTGKLVSDDATITGTIHAEEGTIDGNLTIGSNGSIISDKEISDGGTTVTTRVDISSGSIKNEVSYDDFVSEATEKVEITNGNIHCNEKYVSQGVTQQRASTLDADNLIFADSSTGRIDTAVVTPLFRSNGQLDVPVDYPILRIEVVSQLVDPDPGVLYFVL